MTHPLSPRQTLISKGWSNVADLLRYDPLHKAEAGCNAMPRRQQLVLDRLPAIRALRNAARDGKLARRDAERLHILEGETSAALYWSPLVYHLIKDIPQMDARGRDWLAHLLYRIPATIPPEPGCLTQDWSEMTFAA